MPRDATQTRATILSSAIGLLHAGGLATFSIEGVARRAHVAKGLVLYHYGSRAGLLGLCAERIAQDRDDRLVQAAGGSTGVGGIDAVWEELVRQQEDGTARAWLSLASAGTLPPADGGSDVIAQATGALRDGCATALAAGSDRAGLREAYEALSLALLRLADA